MFNRRPFCFCKIGWSVLSSSSPPRCVRMLWGHVCGNCSIVTVRVNAFSHTEHARMTTSKMQMQKWPALPVQSDHCSDFHQHRLALPVLELLVSGIDVSSFRFGYFCLASVRPIQGCADKWSLEKKKKKRGRERREKDSICSVCSFQWYKYTPTLVDFKSLVI